MADDLYRYGYCPSCGATYHVMLDYSDGIAYTLTCPTPPGRCGRPVQRLSQYAYDALPAAERDALHTLAVQQAHAARWEAASAEQPAWAERMHALSDRADSLYCEQCGTTYTTRLDVRASVVELICSRCLMVRCVARLSEVNALPEARQAALWALPSLPAVVWRDPTV